MVQETKKIQIYTRLKERIKSGFYPPGGQLPKEVDLAAELRVSRITLRPALELLELEDLITRVKGRGTFVRKEKKECSRILVIATNPKYQSKGNQISNPYLYILPCLQSAAEKADLFLEICESTTLKVASSEECIAQIHAKNIKGIFWLGSYFTGHEPLLATIRAAGLPVLLVYATFSDAEVTGFVVLGTDFAKLTQDGLFYLAAMGHRRVAYIGEDTMHNITLQEYLTWSQESALSTDPELIGIFDRHQEKRDIVFSILDRLMDLPEPPTALFCYSDYISLLVYEYMHQKKYRIPEDISVLSIGGQINCDFLNPPLTALEYGNWNIADEAVRIMLELLHGHPQKQWITIPHKLAVRKSVSKLSHFTHSQKELL